jgi:hypothetical protein
VVQPLKWPLGVKWLVLILVSHLLLIYVTYFLFATDCNTVVSGFSGAIESPNFPSEYPDGLDCTWNITAPKGNKINATFSHFELEDNFWFWRWRKDSKDCTYDYVEVQFGDECDFVLEM